MPLFSFYKIFLIFCLLSICGTIYLYINITSTKDCASLASGLNENRYKLYIWLLRLSLAIGSVKTYTNNGFKVTRNLVYTKNPYFKENVTLVTQCSVNHLGNVLHLSKFWNGPISAAVYADSAMFTEGLINIIQLLDCNPNNVDLHFIFPKSTGMLNACQAYEVVKNLTDRGTCREDSFFHDKKNYEMHTPYPVNFLRNIGRSLVKTEYVLVVDADMSPSVGLAEKLTALLHHENTLLNSSVLVVPVFEVGEGVPLPGNKMQLQQLVRTGDVRPFYAERCDKCQQPTNYTRWLSQPLQPEVKVLYSVPWKDPWEPFYVSRANVPGYDERFVQYGFNRISQVCELHVAGYKFLVLDNAFLLHQGFKALSPFHKTKEDEQEKNRILFRSFKQQLKLKYPLSKRRCY